MSSSMSKCFQAWRNGAVGCRVEEERGIVEEEIVRNGAHGHQFILL